MSGRLMERLVIAGEELTDYVRGMIDTGRVRRLIIRKRSGDVLFELSLMVAAGIVVVLTLIFPMLVAISAIAALVAKLEVDIVRVDRGGPL